MAVGIVDVLEIVEIDEYEGDAGSFQEKPGELPVKWRRLKRPVRGSRLAMSRACRSAFDRAASSLDVFRCSLEKKNMLETIKT